MNCIVIGDRFDYDPQLADPSHGDLTVVVNRSTNFYVHRELLSIWSPVFKSMLNNGMKESQGSTIHLQEDPQHAKRFGQLLTHLYPYSRVSIDERNVYSFLHFIDKYDLPEKIKVDCEDYLLTMRRRSWSLLLIAQHHKLSRLLTRHIIWASARLDTNLGRLPSDVLLQLEVPTLINILQHAAKRIGHLRDTMRRMSMAANCNICQSVYHDINVTYCSHCTQFMCLQKMLDDQ